MIRRRTDRFAPILMLIIHAGAAAQPETPPADDIRAIAAAMIADAESRSSLLASAQTAGHNGKTFFLQSDDGAFRLNVRGQVQFRYYLNFRDDADADGNGASEDDFDSGFQTRRTKIYFEGHALHPSLFYRVLAGFNRSDGNWRLEEAFAGWKGESGLTLLWGQFKLPFLREELVSSTVMLGADRSTVSDAFTLSRSQGVSAAWEGESFRIAGAFSDGAAAENSEFASPRRATAAGLLNRTRQGESDYALTGRAEWKPAGSWDQFKDFTSPAGSDFALMLGIAGHVEGGDGSSSAFTSGTYVYSAWTADLSIEGDGWNFYAAGVGGYPDYNSTLPAGADVSNDDYGLVIQGGFMIPETQVEPFARYSALFPDGDRLPGGEDKVYGAVTVGFNYYLYGHAAKFTFDVNWYIEETDPLARSRSGIGQLGDDNDGEVTLRFQWQLLF